MNKASSESLSIRLAVMLAALVAIGPFAIDTYLPALPAMAADFGTSSASLQLTVSYYFLGAAVGQIIGGPVSDSRGRKPVALFGLGLFLVASLLISQVESVSQMLFLRFIQALGGGATVVIAAATVRDRYSDKREAAKMLSLVSMIMLMAPMVAPSFGAVVLAFSQWRTIFVALAVYSGLLLVMVVFYFPETHHRGEASSSSVRTVIKAYGKVLRHTRAMGFILCISFGLGGCLLF
ncbi:Bcr/CflA family efflux MFS transporter [Endozoicomonas montiporae]|uniref:Bcr/CflA family efflux MFS transporter n=1 Tax=Endozoicomonas montiporae TaxID=1027273 RepID=UPI00068BE148|nr:Bcr/CflA family efflux MFS transporter [Endozoicomonas montiporae]